MMFLSIFLTFFCQNPIGIEPDIVERWGPYPNQIMHVWIPHEPIEPPKVLYYHPGRGYTNRPPLDVLIAPENTSFVGGLSELQATCYVLWEAGIYIASAGITGADEESPEENPGLGTWRRWEDSDWFLGPEVTWYEKDTHHAREFLDYIFETNPSEVFPDGIAPGHINTLASMGISAGAMMSFSPLLRADLIVSFNMPSCLPCFKQSAAPTREGYLRRAGTQIPIKFLNEAKLSDQRWNSVHMNILNKGVFFASDFPAEFGYQDCSPWGPTFDLFTDFHDYTQQAYGFVIRKNPNDRLWTLQENALGIPGERTYNHPAGIRSKLLQEKVREWLLEMMLQDNFYERSIQVK